jgi:hypothetical protein
MSRALRRGLGGVIAAGVLSLVVIVVRERSPRDLTGWPIQSATRYSLESRSEIVTDGTTAVSLAISGPLDLEPVGPPPAAGPRMVGAAFTGGFQAIEGGMLGAVDADVKDSLEQALRRPFAVDYERGRFVGIRFGEGLPMLTRQMWKSLAESLQFVHAGGGGEEQWEVEEKDGAGTYRARYLQVGKRRFEKRKLKYVGTADDNVQVEVLASEAEIELTEHGSLESLHLVEKVRVTTSPLPPMTAQLDVTLRRTDRKDDPPPARDWTVVASARPVRAEQPLDQDPGVQRQLDEARVAGAKFEDLLPTLLAGRKDDATPEQKETAGRAYASLAALLRMDESKLGSVGDHVKAKGELSEVLINALRDAGTPKAQELLAELVNVKDLPYERRAQAARGLSHVAAPTEATVEQLKELESEPRLQVQATYGLGSNVYRLKDREPERARQALGHLIGRFQGATDEQVRVRYLVALGNSGHPEALPTLATALEDSSPRIRAAGAEALRRMEGAEAEAMLAAATRDPDIEVRFAAIDAIFERRVSSALEPAVAALMVGEPDYRTRARAVQTAGGWWQQKPGTLQGSLAMVAARDDREDLRQLAQAILAHGTTATP